MFAAADILRAVANGPVALDELEAAVDPEAGDAFWDALDVAVETGLLRVVGAERSNGCYQITRRGKLSLEVAGRARAAA